MDAGNQLTYPVKYIDIGYKDDLNLNNDEAKETGYLHVETSKDSDIIDLPQKDDESILWKLDQVWLDKRYSHVNFLFMYTTNFWWISW